MQTTPTEADVAEFIARIEDPTRRADAEALVRLLGDITGQPPVVWGPAIVGFGQYHYKYASKREGDWFLLGFSVRKQNLTLYLPGGIEQHQALLKHLGKHTAGKGCLCLKQLRDADPLILRRLLEANLAWLRDYLAAARPSRA